MVIIIRNESFLGDTEPLEMDIYPIYQEDEEMAAEFGFAYMQTEGIGFCSADDVGLSAEEIVSRIEHYLADEGVEFLFVPAKYFEPVFKPVLDSRGIYYSLSD
tara:strand:- start:7534 stop:7842 length:309 start_codon:yes stop_codon:yes gene_type:complete